MSELVYRNVAALADKSAALDCHQVMINVGFLINNNNHIQENQTRNKVSHFTQKLAGIKPKEKMKLLMNTS